MRGTNDNLAAELTAGTRPGSSILELSLQEADPFDLTLGFDNYRASKGLIYMGFYFRGFHLLFTSANVLLLI